MINPFCRHLQRFDCDGEPKHLPDGPLSNPITASPTYTSALLLAHVKMTAHRCCLRTTLTWPFPLGPRPPLLAVYTNPDRWAEVAQLVKRLQFHALAISGETDSASATVPVKSKAAQDRDKDKDKPQLAVARVPKDDVPLARAVVNLEVYVSKLKERLGAQFDEAQRANDLEKMATLSRLLNDFGSSMAERFLSTRPYVLKAEAWAFSGDPAWKPPEGLENGWAGGKLSHDPQDEATAEREAQREVDRLGLLIKKLVEACKARCLGGLGGSGRSGDSPLSRLYLPATLRIRLFARLADSTPA